MDNGIYRHIAERDEKGHTLLSLLIDPDKYNTKQLENCIRIANKSAVDYIFVGGSLLLY